MLHFFFFHGQKLFSGLLLLSGWEKEMARWRIIFFFFNFTLQKLQLFFINKRDEKEGEKALLCILAVASLPVLLSFIAVFSCFFNCQNIVSLFPNTLTADIQPVVSFEHMLLNESLDLAGNVLTKCLSVHSQIYAVQYCVFYKLHFTTCLSLSVLCQCSNFQRVCVKTKHL